MTAQCTSCISVIGFLFLEIPNDDSLYKELISDKKYDGGNISNFVSRSRQNHVLVLSCGCNCRDPSSVSNQFASKFQSFSHSRILNRKVNIDSTWLEFLLKDQITFTSCPCRCNKYDQPPTKKYQPRMDTVNIYYNMSKAQRDKAIVNCK